jgi:toxin ParE1/3/4
MARHRLSPEAEADLDEIWLHVAHETGKIEIADRIIDNITERFWLLGQRPHVGRARDDLGPGLRSFPVGGYIILYRSDGKNVRILHVIHGSRDIPRLLRY